MQQVRYVFCFALATLFSVVTFSSASAATLRCQSEGFDYTRCPADTRGGVQLMQQLSETQCREGQNWGYDNRGIWVDKGCAAEFQFGRQTAGRAYERAPGYSRGYVPYPSGQTIRCESEGFGYNRCPADTRGGVQLTEQLSDTQCREGQNWGYDRRGIWVDEGCSGEFLLSSR
jgi:DUF3011 family protein